MRHSTRFSPTWIWLLLSFCAWAIAAGAASPIGIFEDHADLGTVLHPGSAEFDASAKSYTIAGSGDNMWATKDAFQYASELVAFLIRNSYA